MQASLFDSSSVQARLHIEDLQREASQRRLVRKSQKHASPRRRPAAVRLQRAPAR
jgi:hypothetical protein